MLTILTEEYYDDKHQSGLSDMLAAFPPPVQAQSRTGIRQSLRESVLSWPLPPFNSRPNNGSPRAPVSGGLSLEDSTPEPAKKGRRCCGLPLWGFILIIIIIVILVAAAIIIPVEFFVIRRQNNNANTQAAAEQQCQNQLTCQNGGTNVVSNGICSCICTNGFTGFDCSTSDSAGCTTTTISGNTNINNVTVGDAIARLLSQAATNFSVPLDGSTIVSKLNAGNLSCSSENALVTFNGQSTRVGAATDVVQSDTTTGTTANEIVQAAAVNNKNIATITVMAGQSTTTTLTISLTDSSSTLAPTTTVTVTRTFTSTWAPSTTLTSTIATSTLSTSTLSTSTSTTASASPAQSSTATFTATEEALDFARVGVLFVLQQDTLSEASTAQSTLQTFFGSTTNTVAQASNISLSNGNSIDLVNFHIDAGTGLIGSKTTSTKRDVGLMEVDLWGRDALRA